ncbi:MAG TPA: c-type cytochrome [Steroidobacteraceae bacterium]|nr:c-type cytochrome [Steroidobacteraceae bacterium]
MRRPVYFVMSIALLSAAGPMTGRTADTARAADQDSAAPYTVQDGDKVDPKTLEGWKTWRALACERCHGAEQEGLVGPSLVDSLKTLSKEDFHTTVINGRPEKGMPPWGASDMMQKNWEGLYAYLKGRSDGKIKPGHLHPLAQ